MCKNFFYNFWDKFFQNSFTDEIHSIVKNLPCKKINIFDIGCYEGNFSRQIKKKLEKSNKKLDFYLFDINPKLKISDFKYNCLGISDKKNINKTFYLNNVFPSSGSGFEKIAKDDVIWNWSRKILTFNFFNSFTQDKVPVTTLDDFCNKNKISDIELLKIDTEGHEMNVLLGGKKILKKVKILQIEVLDKKKNFNKKLKLINVFLKKYNFKLLYTKKIHSVSFFSRIRASDFLYINDSIKL